MDSTPEGIELRPDSDKSGSLPLLSFWKERYGSAACEAVIPSALEQIAARHPDLSEDEIGAYLTACLRNREHTERGETCATCWSGDPAGEGWRRCAEYAYGEENAVKRADHWCPEYRSDDD